MLYALERLAVPENGGQYAFYYSVIQGFDDFGAGKATTISGIETPDDKTIVFHLTKPTGDFLFRLGMPATGPIPEEVAKCFDGKPGRYGRDLVSSGPYMIEGADAVNASSCAALKPMSGFDQTQLTLVRNPDYDPSVRLDRRAREPARPLRVDGQLERRRHPQQGAGGRARGRGVDHPADGAAAVRHELRI